MMENHCSIGRRKDRSWLVSWCGSTRPGPGRGLRCDEPVPVMEAALRADERVEEEEKYRKAGERSVVCLTGTRGPDLVGDGIPRENGRSGGGGVGGDARAWRPWVSAKVANQWPP